jgi:hypothetical protein
MLRCLHRRDMACVRVDVPVRVSSHRDYAGVLSDAPSSQPARRGSRSNLGTDDDSSAISVKRGLGHSGSVTAVDDGDEEDGDDAKARSRYGPAVAGNCALVLLANALSDHATLVIANMGAWCAGERRRFRIGEPVCVKHRGVFRDKCHRVQCCVINRNGECRTRAPSISRVPM